ncbi:MAG: hypothetical protein PVG90_14775 [Bacillota bacterium]
MELYFGCHAYMLGQMKTVEELYQAGLVWSTPEQLRGYGFEINAVSTADAYQMVREVGGMAGGKKSVQEVYYDACFSENHNIGGCNPVADTKRVEMENFINYPAMQLCNDLNLKEAKYYGLAQQGCSGIFGCIELACNSIRCAAYEKTCLCITGERVPLNCFYDRPAQRLLHSDAASGCMVSNQKLDYQILGYASVSDPNLKASMLELLLAFASLTKRVLAASAICAADIENILTPNFWPDFWRRLATYLKGNENAVNFANLTKSAHAFSSDFIINLKTLEANHLIHAGQYQLSYGYGYGSHLYCLVFKKV